MAYQPRLLRSSLVLTGCRAHGPLSFFANSSSLQSNKVNHRAAYCQTGPLEVSTQHKANSSTARKPKGMQKRRQHPFRGSVLTQTRRLERDPWSPIMGVMAIAKPSIHVNRTRGPHSRVSWPLPTPPQTIHTRETETHGPSPAGHGQYH